jgi:glutamate formiminotransferase/glutamate formiminotransferase/formiminotetrahydrofolate cyclodeaminase
MTAPLVECVPNISEGRDPRRVDAVAEAISGVSGVLLLHRTSDVDHNRSVLTFAGPAEAVEKAAVTAVQAASVTIDLTRHLGVHPRIGALDVLPFVPLEGSDLPMCVAMAHRVGERIWRDLKIPVYFYESAALAPDSKKLEDVRRGGFEKPERRPDLGGPALHPTAGAVIVGARKFLIAFNINLRSEDLHVAKAIASNIRERGGGLPGVKALGLMLHSRGLVQVSMNITDYEQTPLREVYRAVESAAASYGVDIEESELIGLTPRAAIHPQDPAFLKLTNFSDESYIETQLQQYSGRSYPAP